MSKVPRKSLTAWTIVASASAWRWYVRPGPVGQPFSSTWIGTDCGMPGVAADQRVAGPGERAVGGVGREAEIDLVGHLDADHPAVHAEPVDHSAHVLHPRPDVSFLG